MSEKTLKVSKKYAVNDFKTVGLVLILYSLFVLFVPLLLKEIEPIYGERRILGFNAYSLIIFISMVLGTIIPFSILRRQSKRPLSSFLNFPHIGFGKHLVNYIVFFAASFTSIYVMTMIGQYINVSGQLVSSIGITFNDKYSLDVLYILEFVLITPIIEEYAFRGCLLNCLSRYGKFFALIASSIIYSLAHGLFLEMIPAFVMGVILSKMALGYKSIIPSTIVHILYNLSLYVLLLIKEEYSVYMIVALIIIIVLAIIFLITRTYRFMSVKKSNSNRQVTILFLSTFSVTFALMLFVLHSILLIVL